MSTTDAGSDAAAETGGGQPENVIAGLAFAFLSVCFASVLLTLPKLGQGSDVPALQIVFFRYLAGTLCILPVFAWRSRTETKREDAPSGGRYAAWHCLRAVLAVMRITCLVYAVSHMEYANVQAISQTNGVFTILLAALILGETINRMTMVVAAVCLTGAWLVVQPDGAAFVTPSPAALAALFGALLWGVEAVIIRHTAARDRFDRILFIVNSVALAIVCVPAFFLWQPQSTTQYLLFALMGPIAILTQVSNIFAFRNARASLLVPIRYLTVVMGLVLGYVLFAEWPNAQALLGMVLIVGGGMSLTFVASSSKRRDRFLRSR